MALGILKWLSFLGVIGRCVTSPIVSKVSPSKIGYGGGAVTIEGAGFSEDVFNQFDPVLGNKVWFANEFVSVPCQNPINWNFLLENPQDPSTTRIVCDLPPREGSKGSDYFSLILKVDGEEVPNHFTVRYYWRYTPLVKKIAPMYGKPGDQISISGRMFTKEYGNANFRDDEEGLAGRAEESITAVMLGSRECELTDDLGNVYGISLDGDEGSMICSPGGTYIGPLNATVFVSGKYGKSKVDGAYSINSKGQMFMYHTLPEITSVSPNTGADAGGTHVTVQGNSFDSMVGKTEVMLGTTPCEILSVTNTELVCSTPAQTDLTNTNAGGRGLLYEIWTETEDSGVNDTSAADYHSMVVDGSAVEGPYFNETNGFTGRLSGLFVAPYSGKMSFYFQSSDAATLYLSTDSDPANKVAIVTNSKAVTSASRGNPHSDPVELVKGELYYIEATHVQAASSSSENMMKIGLWEHETVYHRSQMDNAQDEEQIFDLVYDRHFETQKVTFNNFNTSGEVTFTHAGIKAKSPVSLSDTSVWNQTFTDMMTYSCEYSTENIYIKQDYENQDYQLQGAGGTMQESVQAYCGSRAMENQERVWSSYHDDQREIDAKKYKWFCFAAKGLSYTGKMSLLILWEDTSDRDRRDWINLYNQWEPSDDWNHHCIDMEATAKNENITWIAGQIKDNSKIKIQDILVRKGNVVGKYYLDEVTIGRERVDIARSSPSLPNDNLMVKDVLVTAASGNQSDSYNVQVVPWTCNPEEDDLELFGFLGADIAEVDTTNMTDFEAFQAKADYLKTADNATFTSASWGGGNITVQRTVRGTRAMTGSIKLSYNNQTIEIPPYPTGQSLAPQLEAFGMIGVQTVMSGSWNKCYQTRLWIKFSKSWGGDVDPIVFDDSNLHLDNGDLSTNFNLWTYKNGGVKVNPGGDFFRLPASQPTVSVSVNGFMAACAAPDCSFTHDSSLTPSLDSVAASGGVLTITGSGFTTDITDFVVKAGDLNCAVTAATETSITCDLEAGSAGVYDVTVVVKSLGVATQPGSGQLTHEVIIEIFANNPTEGSMGGGTTITVNGTGFPASLSDWEGGSVSIAGSECKIISTSHGEFQCITSPAVTGSRRRRSASEISVTLGSQSVTGGTFEYDSSLTPSVSSVSPTSSSPLGGDTLTVEGTAFGAQWGQVLLGDQECTILTWFPTSITCILPSNPHGDYPVHVAVPNNGYADVSSVSPVTYNFVVTDMTPRKGSSMGGTKMKLTGSGFGDCSDVTVMLGERFDCLIDSCNDTEISCTTNKVSKVHQVSNSGRHPTYGPGYVWSPKEVTVQPGDVVDWVWNLQVASDDTGISVHQTATAADIEYDGMGFQSTRSAKGRYQYTFDAPGSYYYASLPVFGDQLFMKGVVMVESSMEDEDVSLSVMMGSVPAAQQVVADTGSVSFSNCTVAASSCVDDPVSTDSFLFTSAVCLTPTVSSVAITSGLENITALPLEGFHGTELSIAGAGFSDNLCQNEVTLGDTGKCTVTSASASEIICTVDGSGEAPLESLKPAKINVNVLNSGNAVLEVADPSTAKFNLVPRISSTNIASGSWAGGSLYVLSGSGLMPYGGQDTVFVTFGGTMGCTIVEVKFDYISCLVPDYSAYQAVNQTSKEVSVVVNMGYDQFSPSYDSGNLTFTFDDAMTGSADSISTSSVGTADSVTITGSNLGSSAKVYLRSKDVARLRYRRSPPTEPVPEVVEAYEATAIDRWEQMTGVNPSNWKCLGGKKCDIEAIHESQTNNIKRYKREADPLFPKYEAWAEESLEAMMLDVCESDAAKCIHLIKKRSAESESSRVKRSVDEAELLEMALLTEGTYEATVTEVSSSNITFTTPALPAGDYDVIVSVEGQGNALTSLALTSVMSIGSISPDTGSILGGQTITISGSGFCTSAKSTVTVGGEKCEVQSVASDSLSCVTPPGSDETAEVSVSSCGSSVTGSYNFSSSATPEISSVSPNSASGPATLSLTGSQLSSGTVSVGSYQCTVTDSSDSSITCDLASLPGGDYQVIVNNPLLGDSNSVVFTSTLEISSVAPSTGSFGGGSSLVVTGTGFDVDNVEVKVCDAECTITAATTNQIDCLTPANDAEVTTLDCDVVVSQPSGSVNETNGFTYDQALTPSVASISPVRGGTGGGTLVTISGSGFADSGNQVMIDGSICDIASESATEITCYTNYHSGAVEAAVVVEVPDQGYASYDDVSAATFYYIDRWSSIWTWGGLGTPLEGEFIVITEGQTILLDTDTPILAFLLVKGGKLMFDKEQPEIELQSKYILLVDGGHLEIGTEEEKYPSKATITMHGNTRCTEMPVFGCKVIGVRNGTLDFHGSYVPVTWTHLAATAAAGDTEITLKQPVTWKVGDHIALATTSDRSSMKENEEHYIAAVSADGLTLTLQDPLKYQHISIEQTFGDRTVETRGEVALLTRNILIRGNYNEAFVEEIPACEQEFSSGGAFSDAAQTCFAGKFGEELGSDEMGVIIIISPKYKDEGWVEARIEYTEFTNAGQAFRVGRYPIHFHLPGNMSTSYVRGNAIHHSNNRACTLHDVSDMVVEHNVVYNVKGLSFFLEDGVETFNTLQYNLAIFTRMSNSLLNPDINPASFWIVNPNNKFRHNACAGGTHFCFWLRPANVPDGPSWTRNYCPKKVPFDEFHNNTAHSMGWYGFWIFGQSNHASYDPHTGTRENGYCDGDRTQARIGSFTTWNNKRGFEIVSGVNIRLENQTHMDHDFAGFEIFTAGGGPYGPDGPGIFNSVIVGHSEVSDLTEGKENACTPRAINLPHLGYTLQDVQFYNFDRDCATLQVRLEEAQTTMSAVRVEGLTFENSPNKVFNPAGETQGLNFFDADGSLTGAAGSTLVGDSPTNPPACALDTSGELGEANLGGHVGSICPPSEVFHRLRILGSSSPTAFKFNHLTVENANGNSTRKWGKMLGGWETLLAQSEVNWISFDGGPHVTNISYEMSVDGFDADSGNYILLGHKLTQEPDGITLFSNKDAENATGSIDDIPTYDTAVNGDWYLTNRTDGYNGTEIIFMLSDKESGRRKKRAVTGEVGTSAGTTRSVQYRTYRCFYEGCLPPPPPTIPAGRPLDFHKWSNDSAWEALGMNMPQSGDTVSIPPGAWMVMDIDPPPLRMLIIEAMGTLEVPDDGDHTLEVEIMLLRGGKFQVGTQDEPFTNNFELVLVGDHYTVDQPLPNGPNLGAKALGVFGFADMHGLDVGVSWTKLAATASAGDTTVELSEAVTWPEGSEIVLSTTSYELHETERRVIASVAGTTITLTEPLEFTHVSTQATLEDGRTFAMQGEVGILSRNVRIVGKDYAEIEDEKFGARVLVGMFEQDDTEYIGFARFSNVEFSVAGQDGWYDPWDPRFALAYLDTGDSVDSAGAANAQESYVKKCAFNFNYNTAIGVFGSNNIPVEDNVVFRFINNGIVDEGVGNKINGNLVTKGESIMRILNLDKNPLWYGGINNIRSFSGSLSNNVAAGCAQGGFVTLGNECNTANNILNNEAHGNQHGASVMSVGVMRLESGCGRLNDFTAWRNYDYGVYLYTENSMEMDNVVAIDNGVGLVPIIFGPSSSAHLWENKYITLQNSVIVGVSDVYDCATEVKPDIFNSPLDRKRGWKGRGMWTSGWKTHHLGMLWPAFHASAFNEWHPWYQPMKSATGTDVGLRGIMHLIDVTFSGFGDNCGGRDLVLRSNKWTDDINWPINATNIQYLDVVDDYKIYVDEPLLSKINPADCTDMDCDGMKKLIIYDNDGSFAGDGVPGTLIPDSSFEWEGNPQRGIGYYRVPKPMITELDGSKIPYEDKMPNLGIYRDDSCVWNNAWRMYRCQDINHRLMIIESMDRDSKIRRLGPIAVLANPGPNGWIDLVNGPQDHSCCSGYTCAERLSTFFTMLATGLEYEIMFTSVAPQNFRLHLLYNEGGEGTLLKIWFMKQQRYDIYVDGKLIMPNNIDTTKEDYSLHPPDDSFKPALTEAHGSNYFDPNTGHLYLLVKEGIVDIKTQPIVILKLGMTVPIENFFEENVVANLAGLLGIDPANIRVTNVVREGSVGRRRRDTTEKVEFEFSIGPPPLDDLVDFVPEEYTYQPATEQTPDPAYTTQSTARPTTTPYDEYPENYMNYDMLQNVQAQIVNSFQTGNITLDIPGVEIETLTMEEPVLPPEAPPPYTSPEERAQETEKTFAEQQEEENAALVENYQPKTIAVPTSIHMVDPDPENVNEMETMMSLQIYVKDQDGKLLVLLGDESDPWLCTVSVLAGPGAVLGNISVPFVGGLATFDSLAMDSSGDGYMLDFAITYPTSADINSTQTNIFSVGGRPLGLRFNPFSILQPQNTSFAVNASIWDEALDQEASADVLVGDFECTASFNNGNFSGTTMITVSAGDSLVAFDDLIIEEMTLNSKMTIDCFSNSTSTTLLATSDMFHVYDAPSTGLKTEVTTNFSYKGQLGNVMSLISVFDNSMGSLSCTGCPNGLLAGTTGGGVDNSAFKDCWSPINKCE